MQASQAVAAASFSKLRSQYLETLNITVEEYEHRKTGAKHYHLASDNPENVFMVALRTVPMDSTGVAHILEHTALCGSKKYPVRDPFFMMIRRSMNTFMNAMTSSDWTAYPFASQNPKDFNNLLEVYLDAVFFSRLDPLDFAQEGHRLEFAEPENPDSALEYKGVVYNEMKGAMSSANSILWQHLCKHLFPTTTYHYNSGGEPEDIPDLSYQQLLNFYRTHYHPSNAIFMTFGNIPAQEHHEKFEALALNEFDKLDVHIGVDDEQRYSEPVYAEEFYPLDEDDAVAKTHILVSWLLGKNTDLEELYKAQLLASVLLDNSASPLLHVLETTELGEAPSPLCGLEDSHREMSFICGLQGCAEDSTEQVEKLILDSLEKVAREGIDQDKVEAALHTLELQQREISGDSYPYGLQLILSSLSMATHRGDPIQLLDIDPVLRQLKQDIKNPDYIPTLIREYLLNNPHRVTLTVKPDTSLAAAKVQKEQDKLAAIKSGLSDQQRQELIEKAKALAERQGKEDDASILPKVELHDVPTEINWPQAKALKINQIPAKFYAQGTNGLSYQQMVISMPALESDLHDVLPYYSACLPEIGIGKRSYLEIQALQASVCGGINASTSMRSHVDNEQKFKAYLVLSSKALYEKQDKLAQLLYDTLYDARFDEVQRIKELVQQICSHKEHSITSQGHALAMELAASGMSPLAAMNYQNSGLLGIKKLKALSASFKDPAALQNFAERLQQVHQCLQQGNKQFLLIGEASVEDKLTAALESVWADKPADQQSSEFSLPEIRQSVQEAWLTNTQVNFCATAFPTVSSSHEDAAALTVLGGFLRNGYLHSAIRERGGAYGGGAMQDSGAACFRFFSYRDPRLEATLQDFRQSIDWLISKQHAYAPLEEAILGVISSLDKPASPAGTAKQAFYSELFGRDKAQRARFRQQVLDVSIEDLKRVGEKYFKPELASTGVVSNKSQQDKLQKLGLNINTLL